MRGDERGAVVVHALVVATALMVATLVMMQGVSLIHLRHRVASAADLAALAASQASARGDDGCAAARAVARRNDARLSRCHMDFDVATVTATAVSPRWWGGRWRTDQRARAAPAAYVAG